MINCQPCLMIQSFHKFNLCMLIYLNVKITFACVPVILGDISCPDIQNDVYQNCEKRTFRPNILYDKFPPVAIFLFT